MAADSSSTSSDNKIETSSYDTALCIIPPAEICHNIDRLRSLYDQAYGNWPPHINLVYPFVHPSKLESVKEILQSKIPSLKQSDHPRLKNPFVRLDGSGWFIHKNKDYNTIYRTGSNPEADSLPYLRATVLEALGQQDQACQFHLTIGQTEDRSDAARRFLFGKVIKIPDYEFPIERLAILVRENVGSASRMRLWGSIEIGANLSSTLSEFWIPKSTEERGASTNSLDGNEKEVLASMTRRVQPESTYIFDADIGKWVPMTRAPDTEQSPETCVVSSYNVLEEPDLPIAKDRFQPLCDAILSPTATADILILQEVSDNLLSDLLANQNIRKRYPFTSHGPPSQDDIQPLPSLRNIVMLSKWAFSWSLLPFHRRHKGALIARFDCIRKQDEQKSLPLIVCGIHLTCGMTDGAVTAKRVQLHRLKNHLTQQYPSNPWIIAGDFNITTSSHTTQTALKDRAISNSTHESPIRIQAMLEEVGMIDAWKVGHYSERSTSHNRIHPGEEGATFDPSSNELAAATSGSSHNRPQRYDKILVKPAGLLGVYKFNMFGFPMLDASGAMRVASDHWGIRATLNVYKEAEMEVLKQHPIEIRKPQSSLNEGPALSEVLSTHGMIPSEQEVKARAEAIALIKTVVLGSADDEDTIRSAVPMVLLPVGSYALGVWTTSSDIDCLCIGSISSKTFFKLARQRIVKASSSLRIRLLRRVEANTGTMLELLVNGIKMDLQYCPAAKIVERWYEVPSLPPTDPIFNLPMLSLRKLKPLRDTNYLLSSIPNLSSFRIAYLAIKLWAQKRGLYSARFGYLGGIHITLLLSWISKRLAHKVGATSAADLVVNFFHHYANFDWKKDVVFDPFFHKKGVRYQRSVREPMVVLGFHAPNSNVANTATGPGLETLVREFMMADAKVSSEGLNWDGFFGGKNEEVGSELTTGAAEFLSSYENYVNIDLQYWGRALHKGTSLLGWLESRCMSLVVDISKAVPGIQIRIWPARFAKQFSEAGDDNHGCYLIGLTKAPDSDIVASNEDRKAMKSALQTALDRFKTSLHSEEKYYDPSTSWIGIRIVKAIEVKDLVLDNESEWGEYVMDEGELSDEEEDPPEEPDEEPLSSFSSTKPPLRTPPSKSAVPISSNKLRPASNVLNRLRWDPNLDPSDYIIGYEDRFLGAREMSVEKWKTEQTDEEFIPQHRILYFRKREGEVVWERKSRVDLVFGSGVGGGGEKEGDVFGVDVVEV